MSQRGMSYQDFTKYSHSYEDVDVGYFSGSDLDRRRINGSIRMPIGRYMQTCPDLILREDQETIIIQRSGTLRIHLDLFIQLRPEDSDIPHWEVHSDIIIELYLDGTMIKRIRDHKVGKGIHMMTFQTYTPVMRYDRMYFRIKTANRGDVDVYLYNKESDVYTTGSASIL